MHPLGTSTRTSTTSPTSADLPETVVLWDCDGTLVDSEALAMVVAIESLADHFGDALRRSVPISDGLPAPTRDAFVAACAQAWMGMSTEAMASLAKEALGHPGAPPDAADALSFGGSDESIARLLRTTHAATLEALRRVEAIDGVVDVLDDLSRAGALQVIVTSSETDRVQLCLDATGIATRFLPHGPLQPPAANENELLRHLLWSAKALGVPTKPDPQVYLAAMQDIAMAYGAPLDLVRSRCTAIEDSPTGARAASAAGVPSVIGWTRGSHVADPFAHAQALLAAGATTVVHRANGLLDEVRRPATRPSVRGAARRSGSSLA